MDVNMGQLVIESPKDSDLKDGDHSLLTHADDNHDDDDGGDLLANQDNDNDLLANSDDDDLLANHSPIHGDHALLAFHEMPQLTVHDSFAPMRSHSPPPLPPPSPLLLPPSLPPPLSSMELTSETMAPEETSSNPATTTTTTTTPLSTTTAHESLRRPLSQPFQNPASDIIASLPFTSNSTDGVVNRRLSWAERRSRYRMRSESLHHLTEEPSHHDHDTSTSGFQYEEFMADSVPCPSCGGGGRIDREHEANLVAVIRYDDDRLKPKQTWIYVIVGIIVSVLLAGTTLFFLFPRSVKMSSDRKRLEPLHVEIDANSSSPSVFLRVQNEFTVVNSNYVPVTFESLTMRVTAFEKLLNSTSNNTRVSIPLRSSMSVFGTAGLFFNRANQLSFIAPYCADPRRFMHTFPFKFDVAAQASVLGHSQDMSMSIVQRVSCGIDKD